MEPPPVVPGEVIMNEVYSRGTAGNLDWVEIYNPSSLPINIGGYKIYDAGGQTGVKEKKTIPAGTIVPAKGFFVVVTDTNYQRDDPGRLRPLQCGRAGLAGECDRAR